VFEGIFFQLRSLIPGCIWEDNIKMDLQEVDVAVWTGLSWLKIETGGGHL
jgi:hypothetical protein